MVWIARRFGRRPALAVLRATALYYLVTAPAPRAASRDYLRRVLAHEPGWRDIYRHFYTFAVTLLDRVYVLSGQGQRLGITFHGDDAVHRHYARGQGQILMLAHMGSFEMLRGLGHDWGELRLRILMDRAAGAKMNTVLERINPALSEMLIDTSESDVDRILRVREALGRGEIVCLMGDRCLPGERYTHCDFLGARAAFPLSPWLLAAMMRVPVVMGLGLYRGDNRYTLHFEELSPQLELARSKRIAAAETHAQGFANRLAAYARVAPYNWFNFYDFWDS
jgi:predicted LPLAT superfamily acyltransferase